MTDFIPQGWYMSGTVRILEKLKIALPPINPLCYDQKIRLQPETFHPITYEWEYKGPHDDDFIPFGRSTNFQDVSLNELYPDPEDLNKNLNRIIQFKVKNKENAYYSDIVDYTWIDCSPKLVQDPPTKTDASCNGTSDGSVNLNFDSDIDSENDFQMQFFIFQKYSPCK